MKNLESIHKGKTGKVSDKWSSYLVYYNRLFAPIQDGEVSLLEIGVQNGGSLETWAQYFCKGAMFIGCDINPKCANLNYEDSRINVIVGDANSDKTYQQISALVNSFDIIIDDGSHQSSDIFMTFINYFQCLKPGGLFIIEDAHTLFMKDYGGGVLKHMSAQNFFYRLVDFLSVEFWSSDVSLTAFFSDFFPDGKIPQFLLDGWVDSIQFRNSMIVIEKAIAPTNNKLGLRYVVGTEAIVEPAVLTMAPTSKVF